MRPVFASILGCVAGILILALAPGASTQPTPGPSYLEQLFPETTLTVSDSEDGFGVGTLRGALIRASALRTKDPFSRVKIIFSPQLKKARVTQGPLPALEGLSSLDCAQPQGKGTIEWASSDEPAANSGEPAAGVRLRAGASEIRNCRILGFPGPAVLIESNGNEIASNQLGEETKPGAEISPLYPHLKRSRRVRPSSVKLSEGASDNLVSDNEIVGSQTDGIVLSAGAGAGNRIFGNSIRGYRNRPLRVDAKEFSLSKPSLEKIALSGENYDLSGRGEPGAEIRLYKSGAGGREVLGTELGKTRVFNDGAFRLEIRQSLLASGERIQALAYRADKNTSELTEPFEIPVLKPGALSLPLQEAPEPKTEETPIPTESTPPPEATEPSPEKAPSGIPEFYPQEKLKPKSVAPDAFFNLRGLGEGSANPDQGASAEKRP